MEHQLVHVGPQSYIEIHGAGRPLLTEQDALDLVGLSWAQGTPRVLLHREVFTAAFFDLRSGLAGACLQKFTNYDLKVAAVIPDHAGQGERFREMAGEASAGRTFAVFADREAAEAWLLT
ncbi:DUF4180 domain-containing protein [Deinococcus maricopensis]|uniref:Transcriptional regulator, PadR-like family n=1 Tax=Deinococcus maricopensis (strain DSM 21211 / LMG 22137 / NRRL B-23946 / LB-34) TaxID=709986 RepID=E8U6P5_DEIML|nr:DUF4180 domain-containing protein [Deinococcus maricopensis]ADV66734.1 transcriptional regulator, PadR-like family [Deinococcus maricopensis DSM 21211]